jgi:probable HAF family extracellular repeat protein
MSMQRNRGAVKSGWLWLLMLWGFTQAITVIGIGSTQASATFQGLGIPSTYSNRQSTALGVSADGHYVVGQVRTGSSSYSGFIWSDGVMTLLTDLSGGDVNSNASGVSINGRVAGHGQRTTRQMAWWDTPSAPQQIDGGPLGYSSASAIAISDDGTTIVGTAGGEAGALRWTQAGGLVNLEQETWPVYGMGSWATAVSSDGSVVVGYTNTTDVSTREAFRWTARDGMVTLGDLDGGDISSQAFGVSPDGTIVVGIATTDAGSEAFLWSAGNMISLGNLDEVSGFAVAYDLSANGAVVVGKSTDAAGVQAVMWLADHSIIRVQDYLVDVVGLDLTGWRLTEAHAISDDGHVLVGTGINPQGRTEAWIATLPEPGVMATIGTLVLLLGWRRNSRFH